MLKAGFIGAGPRAQNAHYPNVNRLDNVQMAAVCELDEGRLDQVVDKYSFPSVYVNHQEMLEREDPDIVYCVMNEQWLLQPALDVLNAGKHIFIEKPPGGNLDEVQQLHDAAVANNVYAMVGFQRRYTAVTREAMKRVANKGVTPSTVVGTFNKQLLGEAAGGFTTTLWNDICHIVDLVRFMAGGEAVEVTSYCDAIESEHRNNYRALIRFDNGATGIVNGTRASGGRVLRSELHAPTVGCYMKIPHEIEILEDNQPPVTMGGWEVDGVDEADVPSYEGVLTMHQHFVDCVQNGNVPLTDLRDAIHTMQLVAQIEGEL